MAQTLVGRAHISPAAWGLFEASVEGAIDHRVDHRKQRVKRGGIGEAFKLVSGEHQDPEGRGAGSNALAEFREGGQLIKGLSADDCKSLDSTPSLCINDLVDERPRVRRGRLARLE
jgi:hypothetical protein